MVFGSLEAEPGRYDPFLGGWGVSCNATGVAVCNFEGEAYIDSQNGKLPQLRSEQKPYVKFI